MQLTPWMPAVESQLNALSLVERLRLLDKNVYDSGWNIDRHLLLRAAPFMWSRDVIKAVLQASSSIPDDTLFNVWNLPTQAVWWYFEEPLPFITLTNQSQLVRSLCFGKIRTEDVHYSRFGVPCCVWVDGDEEDRKYSSVVPSQTFEWEDGQSLRDMLVKTEEHYVKRYVTFPHRREDQEHVHGFLSERWGKPLPVLPGTIGREAFMAATEGLARFVLAATAWLGQKIIVNSPGHIERHRRKEFNRRTKQDVSSVQVISLRKAEPRASTAESTDEEKRKFSVQWIVDGHWRNQVCGPQRADRRLTFIMPYIKGPDGAPLKPQRQKVYTVDR